MRRSSRVHVDRPMIAAREVIVMRYFFDIVDRNGMTRDTEGILLGGSWQMRREAQRALTEFAVEESCSAGQVSLAIRVRDESDREVYNIRLKIEGCAA